MKHVVLVCALLLLVGCAARPDRGAPGAEGPYGGASADRRDTATAQRLTQEAAALPEADAGRAEELLRRALSADLFYGPAHNNLGVLLLGGTPARLYEAANEFEWAVKLMPGHPDPHHNLAMTLERAARLNEAEASYLRALESRPGHMPSMQGLVSLQVRLERTDGQTADRLAAISVRGTDERWRTWAADRLRRGAR